MKYIIYQGTDVTIGIKVLEDNSDVTFSETDDFLFVVYRDNLAIKKVKSNGISLVNGKLIVRIPRSETKTLPVGTWEYQCFVVKDDIKPPPVAVGEIEVKESKFPEWPEG